MSLVGDDELVKQEELIDAVEHLVESAAVSMWEGIVHDVQEFLEHMQSWIQVIFPVLLEYQEKPSRFGQDMWRLGIYMALVFVGFLILTPPRIRRPKQIVGGSSVGSRCTGRVTSSPSSTTSRKRYASSSRPTYDKESDSSEFGGGLSLDEETDEERFERLYDETIADSDYARLVLPPSCKRIETTASRFSQTQMKASTKEPREEGRSAADDDDNPDHRLRTYVAHILLLIRSILSYDYVKASWTLLSWLQGIRNQRKANSNDNLSHMNDDSTVDASVAGSLNTERSSFQRKERTADWNMLSPTVEEEKKESSPCSPTFPTSLSPSSDGCEHSYNDPLHTQRPLHMQTPEATLDDVSRMSPDVSGFPSLNPDLESSRQRQRPTRDESQHYFEAAGTNASYKKIVIRVAAPDKNGYILGDDFLPDKRHTPLLVFVNSRSGSQQGHLLITQLRRLLNPIQVWDLADGSPDQILESFCVLTYFRILVCGGDGTVAWIISTLEKLKLDRKWPPIAILPLGTGNDLARIHGWGGGYNNESLITILSQVSESYVSMLDRWEVTISSGSKKKRVKEVKNFFNYLGVGADAQAALQVHYLRESRPEWFFSRMVNKAWYGIFGAEDLIKASSLHVRKEISLFADGVEIPLPHDSQGIILLNIDSYAGGVPLWSHGVDCHQHTLGNARKHFMRTKSMSEFHRTRRSRSDSIDSIDDLLNPEATKEQRFTKVTACDKPSSCQDGLLDIVSIRGAFHLGQIKVGLSNAQRLCQCREATIVIKSKVAVQVDGEPWRQHKCTIRIQKMKNSATMLHRSVDDGGVETEMSELLDWAEERKVIDEKTHEVLMKEFSRRIESKTRQRRSKPKANIVSTFMKRAMTSNVSKSGGSSSSGALAI